MKRRTKAIIAVAVLAIVFIGGFIFTNNMKGRIEEELNRRYPSDTFTVSNVGLSVFPIGLSSTAEANNAGTVFNASYVWHFGEENEIVDDLYESRTIEHFQDEFDEFIQINSDWLEGINSVPISLSDANLISGQNIYPVRVDILLAKEISTTEDYVSAIRDLASELMADPTEHVHAYRFISFPGSITETSTESLGLYADNLTQPTFPPTPTPTPDPDNTEETTTAETTETTEETEPTTTEEPSNPIYVLELNLLTEALAIDENTIINGIRMRSIGSREIQDLIDLYNLDEEAEELLNQAGRRQTRDEELERVIASESAEGRTVTTPSSSEFEPSKGTVAADDE